MKIEIKREGDKKSISFIGDVNMNQEVVLSEDGVKKLIQTLNLGEGSFKTN